MLFALVFVALGVNVGGHVTTSEPPPSLASYAPSLELEYDQAGCGDPCMDRCAEDFDKCVHGKRMPINACETRRQWCYQACEREKEEKNK